MKKKKINYELGKASQPEQLKDALVAYRAAEPEMVRTQVELSRPEHDFVSTEATRRGETVGAVIRGYVRDKMNS